MSTVLENKKTKRGRKKIPDYLVYEILGNKRIYYRDYKKVLSGELPPKAVIGSSDLQAWIISTILEFLFKSLPNKYKVLSNELGYFYTQSRSKKWLNLDIAVVSKEKLKKLEGTYLKLPPEVVIEVDTKADISKMGDNYYIEKTDKLLKSGIKKVIWVLTNPKKIIVAEKGKNWIITDYNSNIEVLDGIVLNLEKLLKEEQNS
jgi:Uma2 family endonuclease